MTVESFLEDPEHVLFSIEVTGGRLDDGSLVRRETSIAESVFTVALLETTAVFDGHGGEKPEGRVLKDRGKLFTLFPDAVSKITENDDAGLSAVGS